MLPSRYLIGVDSDGTAFDSMNIKHLDAFIPATLEIWPMPESVAARFTEIEKPSICSLPCGASIVFPACWRPLKG